MKSYDAVAANSLAVDLSDVVARERSAFRSDVPLLCGGPSVCKDSMWLHFLRNEKNEWGGNVHVRGWGVEFLWAVRLSVCVLSVGTLSPPRCLDLAA